MANYNRKDHFYNQAKIEGLRSRAAYKLLELNDKYKLVKKNASILDLGSFPGGWVQVAASLLENTGKIIGVDLRAVPNFSKKELPLKGKTELGTTFIEILLGDVTDPEIQAKLTSFGPYDLVMSDMSPHLTGVTTRDQARGAELLELTFEMNRIFCKKGGKFIAKAFPSQETEEIFKKYRGSFDRLDRTCLKSSRTTSNELYIIGLGYRSSLKVA